MPRRGENIRKRQDGRWEGRYKAQNNYAETGRYVSVYGKTYAEVKAKLKTAKEENPGKPHAPERFRDLLSQWLAARRPELKETTLNRYEYLLRRHVLPELGEVPLHRLHARTINAFLENKRKGGGLAAGGELSAAYVRSIAVVIQSALRYGTAEGLCPPITGKICKPAMESAEIRILSQEEQRALEQTIYAHTDPTGIGVLLALYGGLRIGEVCALSWEDVDLAHATIRVRHTVSRVRTPDGSRTALILSSPKTTASFRTVPIHPALLPLLQNTLRTGGSPYVAADAKTFVNPRTFAYRFQRLLERAKLPPIRFHALRHTFATRCIAAGMDVKTLSELMGHSGVTVTMNTYVHTSLETKQRQLAKLESLFIPICGQKTGQPTH